jgi:hypothetical protein
LRYISVFIFETLNKKYLFFFFWALVGLSSCCKLFNKNCPDEPKPASEVTSNYDGRQLRGTITETYLNELSGMVASQVHKGVLWVVNDSGGQNTLYAIDSTAKYLGSQVLNNTQNRDWEEIAYSTLNGQKVLWVGDLGNNQYTQGLGLVSNIYRLPEPTAIIGENNNSTAERISFVYADGEHDTEAMIVDQATNNVYLFTKDGPKSRIYRLDYPQSTTSLNRANYIGELSFGGEINGVPLGAVAASISPDNKEVIIKNYLQILYWKVGSTENLETALKRSHNKAVSYQAVPQEEALAYDRTAKGYYTIAEATDSRVIVQLYYYPKLNF